MYEKIKELPFIEEIRGDEAGFVAKIKDTDYYFSWSPHDSVPLWDEGGGMSTMGEQIEFDYVFDSAPEYIREQLVYHLEIFTAKIED